MNIPTFPTSPPRLLMATTLGDLALVKRIVNEEGEDVNQSGQFGETPLEVAIQLGYVDLVKFFLQKGAIVPPTEEIAAIQSKKVRDIVQQYSDWKQNSRGLAEFSAAAAEPSLSHPSAPVTKLPRDVVGQIAKYLRPSGTAPKGTQPKTLADIKDGKGRKRTSRKRRSTRKQTRSKQ